jgi:ABC-type sugar transport system ATPase subunit
VRSSVAGVVHTSSEAVARPQKGSPAIGCVGIEKSFGHVEALRGASLTVRQGEVTVLFGDNGAGKSTLLRILCGIHQPDRGEVRVRGKPVQFDSIRDAHGHGIEVIHQDLALAPDLTVSENVYLGHEQLERGWRGRVGVLARTAMGARTNDALSELGIDLPSVRVAVRELSGGQRQGVAVARAVMWSRMAILMDEPTAALGTRQSDIVCATITEVARRGLGVFVISHDIPRMLDIADTAAVLRRGQVVLDAPARDLTITDVVHAMVGGRES